MRAGQHVAAACWALATAIVAGKSAHSGFDGSTITQAITPRAQKESSIGVANYFDLVPGVTPGFTALGVIGYQQTTGYTCGPSSVMSVMRYYGLLNASAMNHDTEMEIARGMGTNPGVGTDDKGMVAWLNANGFTAASHTNGTVTDILAHMAAGRPVIICWIDWGGHWVASSAYYAAGSRWQDGLDTIFFADPAAHFAGVNNSMGITGFDSDRFQDMWFNLNGGAYTQVGLYVTLTPNF